MSEPEIITSGLNQAFQALRSRDPAKVSRQVISNHPDYKRVPSHNYAPTAAVSTGSWGSGMMRTAATSNGIIYGQPQFFSPVHTPINWQIPSKRLEQYQWCFLPNTQVLTEDFTYSTLENTEFNCTAIFEDDVVDGGFIFDAENYPCIMNSEGLFSQPTRVSMRDCTDKRCFSFKSIGNYRVSRISEEHHIFVLDGDLHRKNQKVINAKQYRLKKGILPNGVEKVKIQDELIKRVQAHEVKKNDYLLTPIPKDGDKSIDRDLAWLIGYCVADGHLYTHHKTCNVGFTGDKGEVALDYCNEILGNNFDGTISSRRHGDGNGWRVCITTKKAYDFFRSYIVNKGTSKKFSKEVFDLDKETKLNILAGYFDGDGSLEKPCGKNGGGRLIANCYSKDLSDQIYWLLISCGIVCSLGKYPLYGNHYKTSSDCIYRILVPSSQISVIAERMRGDKIPKDFIPKKERELKFFYEEDGVKYLASPIEKIEEFLYSGKGFDIEMTNERHALVADGYVCSNSRFFYESEPKVASAIDFYCFDPETNILMSDGKQQRISSVVVGDLIRSHDGSINKVEKVNVRNTTNEKMLKIKVAGVGGVYNAKTKVTPGHKILTDKDGNIQFVSAGELSVGDYLLTPCGYGKDNKNVISNDMAWLIGLYAAEGCAIPYNHVTKTGVDRRDHKGVYLTISIEETDLRDLIIAKLKSVYGSPTIQTNYDESHGRMTIKVYGQHIADDLIGASPGIAQSRSKRFSPWVMKLSSSNLINILAGFLSGDGCYNATNGFQGVGRSKALMEQIANICDMLGVEYSYTSQRILNDDGTEAISFNVRISRRACGFLIGLTPKIVCAANVNENMANNCPYFVKGNYIYRKICSIKEYMYDGNLYDLSIGKEHSYVANRIAVHNSDFPMSDFEHECKNRDVKLHFDKLKDKLELPKWCRLISHEVHLLGDCFPFAEIDCPICYGSGRVGDEICEHEGGTIRRVVILNPDYIEVESSSINPDPRIALRPDEELINMVQRRMPGYERLSPDVVALIASGQPIPLDNRNVSHLKYGECGYQKFGIGMVRRLFPILSYKTKLMVAQWIVAERLIVPIKVVKVGSDERPAGPADIADVQSQLSQTANDPNLTIVTHHAFDIDFIGAAGRVLTLSNEFEFINQEVLDGMMINNALLNGEGPNFCHSDDTRILTNNGLKYRIELDIEKDLIATFNQKTGALEYQKAIRKHEYDYNSIDGDDKPLKHFKTNRIDILVTPNHKMLWSRRKLTTNEGGQKDNGQKDGFGDWQVTEASEVKSRGRFRDCFDKWDETTTDEKTYCGLSTEDFLTVLGWYISEGYRNKWVCKDGSESISKVSFSQSPSANKTVYDEMSNLLKRNKIFYMTKSRNDVFYIRKSDNPELLRYLSENCGGYANTKCIPADVKNMSNVNLRILLNALVDGDGSERPATKKKQTNKKYYSYTTVSKQLRDDVIEILFKLGYSPRFNTITFDSDKLQTQYTISWGDTEMGKFPVLDSRKWDNDSKKCSSKSEQVISDEDYIGKVWCVEVPNHFIVTERNGLFGIHGNSSAAVGIEAMIQRLETWRGEVAKWIEKTLYLPEAKRQGFVDINPDSGEEEYIYPRIKWGSMHLRDQQQYRTFIIQLYDKGLLSAQTVLEAFDLDPDMEIERKRYDALQFMAIGQGFGADPSGGAGGGGFGGGAPSMPALGGDGGGDMGGEPPIGAPGSPGGDMGGGIPSPVGGGVGGPMPKSSSVTAEIADPNQFGGKVLKQKTRDRIRSDQQKIFRQQETHGVKGQKDANGQMRDEKGRIMFTKAERDLIPILRQAQTQGLLAETIYPQYRVNAAGQEYALDFGIPELKIGIEADGEIFHSSPDQVERDNARDAKLQQQGWTILRFTDSEIQNDGPKISRTVLQEVMRKKMWMKKNMQEYQDDHDPQVPQQ